MSSHKKILVLEWNSFGLQDAVSAFTQLGYDITYFSHPDILEHTSTECAEYLDNSILADSYDFIFSLNYYPAISKACNKHNLKYISIVYDSPHINLYTFTVIYPCNMIFVFDSAMYNEFHSNGINTIYYMPLCVNVERYDNMPVLNNYAPYTSDVSFVGALYNEKHNLFDRLTSLSERSKGYLQGIMEAQSRVYGYYMIDELINDELVKEMYNAYPYDVPSDSTATQKYVYSEYFLSRKITSIERIRLLRLISDKYNTALYTSNDTPMFPHIINRGPCDYYNQMPYVFKHSKINLNITLKSIKAGIPLRILDIMGCGGFVLTNYQADLEQFFEAGVDYVYYNDEADLLLKIDYYLRHEEERLAIARHGYETVKSSHTWIQTIACIIGLL